MPEKKSALAAYNAALKRIRLLEHLAPDEIAWFFRRAGIQGGSRAAADCPVANYARGDKADWSSPWVVVCPGYVEISHPDHGRRMHYFTNPGALSFIRGFDLGDFPYLES